MILSDVGNVSAVDMFPSTLKILAIGTKPPNLRGGKKKSYGLDDLEITRSYSFDDLEITRVKVTSSWLVMMEKSERLILKIRQALWTVLSISLP